MNSLAQTGAFEKEGPEAQDKKPDSPCRPQDQQSKQMQSLLQKTTQLITDSQVLLMQHKGKQD
jgi:hypothetical protein